MVSFLLLSFQYPISDPLLPHLCFMPCLSPPLLLDHCNYTWRRAEVMEPLLLQFSPTSFSSSLLTPNTLLSTMFSNTLSLCSSLNIRDQVSYPYRKTGKNCKLVYSNLYVFRKDSGLNSSEHYPNSISSLFPPESGSNLS